MQHLIDEITWQQLNTIAEAALAFVMALRREPWDMTVTRAACVPLDQAVMAWHQGADRQTSGVTDTPPYK